MTFAERVDGFVTGEGSPGAPKRTEMLAGLNPAFDGAAVLFHRVVELTPDPIAAIFVENPVGIELPAIAGG